MRIKSKILTTFILLTISTHVFAGWENDLTVSIINNYPGSTLLVTQVKNNMDCITDPRPLPATIPFTESRTISNTVEISYDYCKPQTWKQIRYNVVVRNQAGESLAEGRLLCQQQMGKFYGCHDGYEAKKGMLTINGNVNGYHANVTIGKP